MTPATTIPGPLGRPEFATYWAAQTISRLGDPITLIALAASTYRVTQSAFATGFAVLVATLPQATFGFFGGAVADSWGHRRAMVICDLVRALAIGAIPIVLHAGLSLAVVFGLVIAAGLAAAVFNPARIAVVPSLVPTSHLITANSMVYASDRVVEVVGAAAAGILVAAIGDFAFFVDAATFAIAALLMLPLARREPPGPRLALSAVIRSAGEGIAFIRGSSIVLANTLFALVAQASIPVINGLLPVLIFRRFANNDFNLGAQQFGYAEAALALGAVSAAIALPSLRGGARRSTLALLGFLTYGLALMGVAASSSLELLLFALLLAGIGNVLFVVPNMAIIQEATPAHLRARVFGARISLLSLSWLPIVLFAGGLADVVDVAVLIGAAGAFTVLVALVASRVPAVADVP